MKLNSGIAVATALSLAMAGLAGCEREGPMERTGEQIDNAAENAAEKMENASEEAADKMENAGEELRDEARDAKE